MELNYAQIIELIPHRYPFLFLDGVTEYVEKTSITGYKLVTQNEPYFQGHFPGNPVMPGVIQIEALAQLGCVFMCLELGEKSKTMTPLFLGIDKAKFRSIVTPGMRLDMRIDVIQERGGLAKVKATASVDGKVATQAELTCMMKA